MTPIDRIRAAARVWHLAAHVDSSTVEVYINDIDDALSALDAAAADRDYWREQATAMAPCVDEIRRLALRVIPGGPGCALDPVRAVDAALVSLDAAVTRATTAEASAERSAVAAVDAARELGAVASAAVAQRDALGRMYHAVGESLGLDHDGDIPEAIAALLAGRDDGLAALRMVTVRAETAEASLAALAGAVESVRAAVATVADAGAQYHAAWDAVDAMPPTASQSEGIAATLRVSYEAQETLDTALRALLRGAPSGVVSADVVARYLAADDTATVSAEWRSDSARISRDAARTALDAALAAAGRP